MLFKYNIFYANYGDEIGHYFRNFYHILKFIQMSSVEHKSDYSGILKSQLSNPELVLLFYNGISKHGEQLRPLAENYTLFENIELKMLNNPELDVRFYNRGAFGDQADSIFKSDT